MDGGRRQEVLRSLRWRDRVAGAVLGPAYVLQVREGPPALSAQKTSPVIRRLPALQDLPPSVESPYYA